MSSVAATSLLAHEMRNGASDNHGPDTSDPALAPPLTRLMPLPAGTRVDLIHDEVYAVACKLLSLGTGDGVAGVPGITHEIVH